MFREKLIKTPIFEGESKKAKRSKKRLAKAAGIPVIGMQHSHSPELFEIDDKVEFAKTVDLTLEALYE